MGFGILEPNTTGHTPGTVLLDQQAAHSEGSTGRLKHAAGKNSNIVLAPQPSEDPNDPLNWSQTKKNLITLVIFLGVVIHGSPLLNAGIVVIAVDLKHSVTDIAKLGGYLLIGTATAGPFASAFGRKYGKRPVYIFSSIIGLIGCIISEVASGYNQLLAGRVLQGIAVAAYESLAVASIGDMFFVHERGPRVAIIVFLLAAISNGISIVAGVITANLGWHYNFHILTPFAALQTIAVIAYAPETIYRRSAIYDIDTVGSEENFDKLASVEARAVHHLEKAGDGATDLEQTMTQGTGDSLESMRPKKTYWQELSVYNGAFVEDSIIKMVLACLAILLNLGALYQIISTGIIIAWYVAVAILTGVIFAIPPYLLGTATIGYLSTGPLIGGFLGCLVPFLISAPMIRFLTRKNRGVYEPEFCLLPISVGGLAIVAGLLGWGFAIKNLQSIYVVAFLWGLMLFGMSLVATFTTQWALDAYRQHSTELFVMNMVFKNFFYYGLTNYIIQWYLKSGPVQLVGVMAGLSGSMCLLAIPMYIFGKKYRHYWHHHNLIKMLRLE
ncbi:major facilitator superfamily domain-containing protein, partial [Exophiala viscosa]|uniref:major facilitator superfamily domain-containing protein n=1 Tax=Exophiala viscosa TaxID=2486360 RepID=UPI00219B8C29